MEIIIPTLGESLSEAVIGRWLKKPGDVVCCDEVIIEVETDKVTLEVCAPAGGVLSDIVSEGARVKSGEVVGRILVTVREDHVPMHMSDVTSNREREELSGSNDDRQKRVQMSTMRRSISHNLKESQHTMATLTTFNEIDLSKVSELRSRYQESFQAKYGIKLGLMPFFIKASVAALRNTPPLNAQIDGEDIIYKYHYDIGVAVATDQGLIVPTIRDADRLSFAEIEQKITNLSDKARRGKISLSDVSGGTFSITNGGVYGSLFSTPIIKAPQSGILGMHNIVQRPVVVDGRIEIRPMMYVALSYDHRLVDGREAVTFLVQIKNMLEQPQQLLLMA